MSHEGKRRQGGLSSLVGVLLATTILLVACVGWTHALLRPNKCSLDNLPERLPNSLNTLSYLSLNDEFHIHGEFFVNFTEDKHQMYFDLQQESAVRLYIAPHKNWDIDIYLFSNNSREYIDHSGLDIFTEEVMQVTLGPGSYRFQFNFLFGWMHTWDWSPAREESTEDNCETVVMELAIVPKNRVLERTRQFACDAQEVLPELNLSQISETTGFVFNSTQIFNINTTDALQPGAKYKSLRMVRGYNFTLPRIKGTTGMWRFQAELGYDFITTGSLGLMLDLDGTTVETNIDCANDLESHWNGGGLLKCTIGIGDQINQNILRWVVESEKLLTLWIYDVYGENDRSLARCDPFTFKLAIEPIMQTENMITCEAPFLPKTLNAAGLLNDRGYLSYREHVFIDLTTPEHNIDFTLTRKSNFRVFVEEHRVDIDIRLNRNGTTLASSLSFGKQETIVMELDPGTYSLNIKYFGSYDPYFCETFLLMLGIAPSTYTPSTCSTTSTLLQKPDLSGLAAMATDGLPDFQSTFASYRFPLSNHGVPKQQIFEQQFTLEGGYEVRVAVGTDFLLGDMELLLTRAENNGPTKTYAEHVRDGLLLHEMLQSGTYTLSLSTANTQGNPPDLSNFPNCLLYTFLMNVRKEEEATSQSCWDFTNITQVITTANFVKSPEYHVQGSFLIPRTRQALVAEDVSFSVTRLSQFRIFSEPHAIDIDFHLSEDGILVASSLAGAQHSEEIVYRLTPDKTYKLTVQYYARELGTEHCSTFDAEISIAPVDWITGSCVTSLPPKGVIPSTITPPPGTDLWTFSGDYQFGGASDQFFDLIEFNITTASRFRATVFYDFVFGNIRLRLLRGDESTSPIEYSILTHAETFYNRDDLPVIDLSPGRYALEVSESATFPNAQLNRCLPFSLAIGIAPETASTTSALTNTAYTGCHDYPLPTTLNTLSGLSVLSGGQYQMQRNVIANLEGTKTSWVDFHVNTTSVFRVLVPALETLDVDIVLYAGSKAAPLQPLASLVSFGEESVAMKLQQGDYTMKFTYYGLQHHTLPPMAHCTSYPIELAIIPLSILEAIPALTSQTCAITHPPTIVQKDLPFRDTFQYVHSSFGQTNMSFALTTRAELEFDLRFDFPSGGLTFTIFGRIRENPTTWVSKEYHAKIGTNHAFISELMHPGEYTVVIQDTSKWNRSSIDSLPCSQFELIYYLHAPRDGDAPTSCDDVEDLPIDLYSDEGGSQAYGGPQDSDGSIRIFGSKFRIPDDTPSHYNMYFNVVQESFIRIFALMEGDNDVDFYVYHNASDGWPLLWFNGFENTESGLGRLQPKSDPYRLDVSFFRHDFQKECNYFQLGIEISPVVRTYQSMACPMLMPFALTRAITFSADHPVDISGIYYFNKQQMDLYTQGNVFVYRIELTVEDDTLLFADLTYDFLTANFYFLLSNTNNDILKMGISSMDTSVSSDHLDFHNVIEATMAPGRYHLDIIESIANKDLGINATHCHKFGFTLNAYSQRTPHVISVEPGEGDSVNPLEPFVISVRFTDSISDPSPALLQQTVVSNHLAYLKTTGSDRPSAGGDESGEDGNLLRIPPNDVSYFEQRTVVALTWLPSQLELGQTYELVFDFNRFAVEGAPAGTHFANAQQSGRIYVFSSWDCNGHGRPNHNLTHDIVCTCDPPYTGDHCTLCMDGYHSAGTQCVADVKCTASTCNGHGTCRDSAGFPECTCNTGYATVGDAFCSACAEGYTGYPNCVPKPPPMDESNRCKAPLLPSSFDGPAYLGFDGEMRIYGDYFIDPLRREHEITFSLKQRSALRIYLAPHWVDVDVWLYKNTQSGLQWLMHGGLGISKEESLVTWLDPTVGNDNYLLKFRYYIFSTSRPECETVNMDIAITPANKTTKNSQALETICRPLVGSPSKGLPDSTRVTLTAGTDFFYKPNTIFGFDYGAYIASTQTDDPTSGNKGIYFWNRTISVPKPPTGKVALLQAKVGFRFVEGSYALLLEPGEAAQHCDALNADSAVACVVGDNLYNENVLTVPLSAGIYTIWLYMPRMPLTNCTAFEFEFSIEYRTQEEDSFACKGAKFPFSLNEPNYLDGRGSLHFQEKYLIEHTMESVNFDITVASLFRVAVSADLILGYHVYLFDRESTMLLYQSADGHLFENLAPGNYTFQVMVFDQLLGVHCPGVELEMQIMPANQINLHPDICGNGPSQDRLPTLPLDLGARPFSYNASGQVWFVTYKYDEIVTYPIRLQESMRVFAQVDSAFMGSGLELELVYMDGPNPVRGDDGETVRRSHGIPDFNANYMDKILAAGSYNLKIVRPTRPKANAPLPSCAPFDFKLSIEPVVGQSVTCYGEEIPSSLDTIRFLQTEDDINYQSRNWKIPAGRFPSHNVYMSVKDKSLFRAYAEPHYIDIDLKVWQISEGNDDVLVSNAKNGFYDEEVVVAMLDADKQYKLEIIFWKWNVDQIPDCPTFNMEFALQRIATIPSTAVCGDGKGGDHWPPQFPKDMPAKPYHYDSTNPTGEGNDKAELLYFQQASDASKSRTYSFTLSDTTDFFAEVGYDFMIGDLVLKLVNTITGDTYYGHNGYNRNYLSLMNLIYGTYELTIYEPTVEDNPAHLKCAYFTFRCYILPGGDSMLLDAEHPSIPRDLSRLPYMMIDGSVHLQNDYALFQPGLVRQAVAFRVDAESELRFSATVPSSYAKVGFSVTKVADGTTVQSGMSQGYMNIHPGAYNLNIDYTSVIGPVMLEGRVISNVELAIRPTSDLQAIIASFPETTASKPCLSLSQKLSDTLHIKSNDTLIIGSAAGGTSRFTFRGNDLSIEGSKDVARGGYVLGELRFMLMENAILYAKAGFDFLLEDLVVHITSPNLADHEFPYGGVYGDRARNINQVNSLLGPGIYVLSVSMPMPGSDSLWELAKHRCIPYSLSMYVQPTSQGHDHVDCMDYDQLPWNLDTPTGGAKPFGGPIVNGSVHISGNRFLIPSSGAAMAFTVSERSVLSVFVSIAGSFRTKPLTLRLLNRGPNGQLSVTVEPFHVNSTVGQRLEQFSLDSITRANSFELQILADPNDSTVGSCPYFTFALALEPYNRIKDSLVCGSHTTTGVPNQLVRVGDNGVGVDYMRSSFTWTQMQANMHNGVFSFPIRFEVKTRSSIHASIAFNSLSNAYSVKLERSANTMLGSGRTTYVSIPSNEGSVDLIHRLSGIFGPDNYTVTISQPAMPLFQMTGNCFPFTWDLAIVASNLPTVESVNPEGGFGFSLADLTIMVTFSSPLYDSTSRPLNSGDGNIVKSAFNLKDRSTEALISPASSRSLTETYQTWELTFSKSALRGGAEYELQLASNILFNEAHTSVILVGKHRYLFASADCSDHGLYDVTNKKCECDPGYTGPSCSSCAAGYVETVQDSQKVCVKQGEDQCKVDTCGCLNPNDPKCTPLGTCSIVSGAPKCDCGPMYAGDHCERCAEGFVDYPHCRKEDTCNPHCVNGECDTANNKCICQPNWKGSPTCDKCTPGWTGPDCKTRHNEGGGNGLNGFVRFLLIIGIIIMCFVLVGALTWFGWWAYKRYKANEARRFFPLGLAELEGGLEMQPTTGGDDDDDIFADYDARPTRNTSSISSILPNIGGGDDDDDLFNPRASDKGSSSSATTSLINL